MLWSSGLAPAADASKPDAWQYSEQTTALHSGHLHNALWNIVSPCTAALYLHLQRTHQSRKPGSTASGRRPWAACRPAPRLARRAAARTRSQTPRGIPGRAARARCEGRRAARCAGTAPSTALRAAVELVTASAPAAAVHNCMLRQHRMTWIWAWHTKFARHILRRAMRRMCSSSSTGQHAA